MKALPDKKRRIDETNGSHQTTSSIVHLADITHISDTQHSQVDSANNADQPISQPIVSGAPNGGTTTQQILGSNEPRAAPSSPKTTAVGQPVGTTNNDGDMEMADVLDMNKPTSLESIPPVSTENHGTPKNDVSVTEFENEEDSATESDEEVQHAHDALPRYNLMPLYDINEEETEKAWSHLVGETATLGSTALTVKLD